MSYQINNGRLQGIDILKIISIIMILLLHILGQGGVIEYTSGYSKLIFKAVQMFSLCAVNILCICTGFLMVNKDFNHCRVVKTMTLVVGVNFIIFLVFLFAGGDFFTGLHYMKLSLSTTYWYVVDYIIILFIMPYLKKMIYSLNRNLFKRLIHILLVVATLLPIFLETDIVGFNGGYSLSWMIVLFFVGAYEKLYGNFLKRNIYFLIISIVSYVMMMVVQIGLRSLEMDYLDIIIDRTMSYTSPFVFVMALFLFKAIYNIRVNRRLEGLFKWYSSASLMAYIFHCNGIVYTLVVNDLLKHVCNKSFWFIVFAIVAVVIGYYTLVAILNSLWNYCFKVISKKNRA